MREDESPNFADSSSARGNQGTNHGSVAGAVTSGRSVLDPTFGSDVDKSLLADPARVRRRPRYPVVVTFVPTICANAFPAIKSAKTSSRSCNHTDEIQNQTRERASSERLQHASLEAEDGDHRDKRERDSPRLNACNDWCIE